MELVTAALTSFEKRL